MYQAAVIYAPDSPEMSALSEQIARKLGQERLKVVRKEAAQAIVPDLSAANLVLLGSAAGEKGPIHQDFAEILRALKGISLAGRTVGAFALRSAETLQAFREALADCEVPLDPRQFVSLQGSDAQDADLGAWLGNLIEQLEQLEVREGGR